MYNADMKLAIKDKFIFWSISSFYFLAVFNPLLKKYDYGAGFPLVLLFIVMLLIGGAFLLREKREKSVVEKSSLLAFGIFMVLSFVLSQTKNVGLSELMAWLSVILLYQFVAYRRCAWMPSFLAALRFFAILAVILGYVLYFVWPEVRMQGPFFNLLHHSNVWPNAFALFLVMVWPLFLSVKRLGFRVALLSLVFSALLLTFSRGALIVLGGQLLMGLIYYFKRINWKALGLALTLVASTLLLFLGANALREMKYEVVDVEERVNFDNNEGLTSKQERIDFWLGAIELAKQKPLLGWGPSSFRQAYNPIQKTFLGNSDHPHNVFLKILVENGAFALASFLTFLIGILVLVLRRFTKLEKTERDIAFILIISIAGAFAHNLIDYNFNFYANLLLLFLFLAFLRSLLIVKVENDRPVLPYFALVLLGILALYEGTLLVMNASVYDKSFLGYSFFPRNHYLEQAESSIAYGRPDSAIKMAEREISLNSLDAQAYYLRGVAYCQLGNTQQCKLDFEKAIELNPLNEWGYYLDYFRVLDPPERPEFIKKVSPILNVYFTYVENNVHFTAYTSNVEAAAELAILMSSSMSPEEAKDILDKKDKMLKTAESLRAEKDY